MPNSKVGVVIPTYNEKNNIVNTLNSIVHNNTTDVKIYLSDDNSSDTTVGLAADFLQKNRIPYKIILNDGNNGAGYCRNSALDEIAEPLTLFFDADDLILPNMLDRAVSMATKVNSDVLLMAYQCRFPGSTINLGMAGDDNFIFYRAIRTFGNRTFSTFDHDSILCLTPFPWNRLIKTSYAKRVSLRFSQTPVHNDVLAHWNLLTNAKDIALFESPFCTHNVDSTGNRLSNISDARRISVLQVFDEIEDFFNKNINLRDRFYHLYVKSKLALFNWCWRNLDEEYRGSFKSQFTRSFLSLSNADLRMLFDKDPDIANSVLDYRTSVVYA
ncbi:glycosyltransferase family A protein [Microbulbifer sp. MKSA007]|uniref:glycosyltransferase family A protein n=1 Tax=Microbulbifer sp. SSSA008 TaxID=3243380 RepID=UPI002B2B7570|nr:glycosyltransferase family A protein [Microbulbifer sp. MKSA007]